MLCLADYLTIENNTYVCRIEIFPPKINVKLQVSYTHDKPSPPPMPTYVSIGLDSSKSITVVGQILQSAGDVKSSFFLAERNVELYRNTCSKATVNVHSMHSLNKLINYSNAI